MRLDSAFASAHLPVDWVFPSDKGLHARAGPRPLLGGTRLFPRPLNMFTWADKKDRRQDFALPDRGFALSNSVSLRLLSWLPPGRRITYFSHIGTCVAQIASRRGVCHPSLRNSVEVRRQFMYFFLSSFTLLFSHLHPLHSTSSFHPLLTFNQPCLPPSSPSSSSASPCVFSS